MRYMRCTADKQSSVESGSPRMHVELCEDGVQGGRHGVARLMRDNGIKSEQVWRTGFQTRQQATNVLGLYIEGFYNLIRRHEVSAYK